MAGSAQLGSARLETVREASDRRQRGSPRAAAAVVAGQQGATQVEIVVSSGSRSAIVRVTGELDVATSPRLRTALTDVIEAGQPHLLVDLTSLGFIDSSGLGVLVGALKRVRSSRGSLVLAFGQPRFVSLFTITGLTRVFTIEDTVEAAAEHSEASDELRQLLSPA